ncbi:alpha,alpha-trehalase TreF [Pelomonas sp. KK5]|uniref:alpha,alpha-trehalase TreF n=1 Tax=Pelomonas sp. KK5 TaxID=1855730 RepID=UPI00097BEC28|nr:alpha,alpha-trehalase TreF [Pelomonas sp. KK5]
MISTPSPQQQWGPLFEAVQQAGLFPDSKAFADAVPRHGDAGRLLQAYEQQRAQEGFDPGAFVRRFFVLPGTPVEEAAGARLPIEEHIRALWPRLLRHDGPEPAGSLLALPHPYVVPGGRFREIYYWDSAFTMQALLLHGHRDIAQDMLDNFVHLVRQVGHVPNSNRSYMLSRSQPPLLFRMVELLWPDDPGRYLDVLRAEHRFWMAGEDGLAAGDAARRVVRLADGTLLNRYWDDHCTPRDESWREDVETAGEAPHRPAAEVWRELRAAAESGWDFSSRWCADPQRLCTIETSAVLPIDLNALLWGLEQAIARGARQAGAAAVCDEFETRAAARADALRRHLWSPGQRAFVDLHWPTGTQRELTAATVVPLYAGLTTPDEAAAVADTAQARLLGANGLRTTLRRSAQQWDQPNGWAPLQIMAAEGLRRHGHDALAADLSRRWLGCIERVYESSGKLVEKYDTEADRIGGGGEYPTQDGFGWTNASYVILKQHLTP